MADLGAYLERVGGQTWKPGAHDCCAFPADWAIECGWPDPMAEWRGQYTTEDEALALIAEAGGLAELFRRGMASAGIPLAAKAVAGDIAVIRLDDEHEAGAVFTGKRWTFAAVRGFAASSIDPAYISAIWAVGHG